jgi:hypothetical protein
MMRADSSYAELVKNFFRRGDSGDFPVDMFAPNFEFFYPKFGIGRGVEDFFEMARGVMTTRARSQHHLENLVFTENGRRVAVEGTTEGTSDRGVEWRGGLTSGGRFCTVFVFNEANLITRMYIYLDPDVTGEDERRFLWPKRTNTT